ncbi:uncharacterized protein ARMOST_15043 [Armillaria ostoyae]|uniref:Uncharacterized protein n=1 Tax=Armillaria ostoyae TaxID=47428 RepID=A0A284RS99_ARMOS|nr:uncharacterized protein ARMOST_15043 [Armillaria ostoyae]
MATEFLQSDADEKLPLKTVFNPSVELEDIDEPDLALVLELSVKEGKQVALRFIFVVYNRGSKDKTRTNRIDVFGGCFEINPRSQWPSSRPRPLAMATSNHPDVEDFSPMSFPGDFSSRLGSFSSAGYTREEHTNRGQHTVVGDERRHPAFGDGFGGFDVVMSPIGEKGNSYALETVKFEEVE